MAENSKIEWTDHTFNPWVGCTKVSLACDWCYAESWAKRAGSPELWQGERRRTTTSNWREPLKWNAKAAAEGRRYRVFCASLADVFDAEVPDAWRDDLFALVASTPHLDWLLLTKRPKVARTYIGTRGGDKEIVLPEAARRIGLSLLDCKDIRLTTWPLSNIWLGTTVENQAMAETRIPHLLATPAAVHFLSCEPLLGPVDLTRLSNNGDYLSNVMTGRRWHDDDFGRQDYRGGRIDWVICGGESGPHARPSHPDWFRSLRDQCTTAGVPFFFKQHGEWREFDTGSPAVEVVQGDDEAELPVRPADLGAIKPAFVTGDGRLFHRFEELPEDVPARLIERLGKARAGRLLDGREWNEMPSPYAPTTPAEPAAVQETAR